jgi:hypothetical protein
MEAHIPIMRSPGVCRRFLAFTLEARYLVNMQNSGYTSDELPIGP